VIVVVFAVACKIDMFIIDSGFFDPRLMTNIRYDFFFFKIAPKTNAGEEEIHPWNEQFLN
jgi:hypothetical protein